MSQRITTGSISSRYWQQIFNKYWVRRSLKRSSRSHDKLRNQFHWCITCSRRCKGLPFELCNLQKRAWLLQATRWKVGLAKPKIRFPNLGRLLKGWLQPWLESAGELPPRMMWSRCESARQSIRLSPRIPALSIMLTVAWRKCSQWSCLLTRLDCSREPCLDSLWISRLCTSPSCSSLVNITA